MGDETTFRWDVTDRDLEGLTPSKARDMLVLAMLATHGDMASRTCDPASGGREPIELAMNAESMVRDTFRDLGYDWESPSASELAGVVEALAREAASCGTPLEVIEQHLGQMRAVHERLAAVCETP